MAVKRQGKLEGLGDDLEEENEHGEDTEEGGEDEESDKSFNLDEVLLLGGTKADFVMLDSLNENVELVDGGKKSAMDDLKEGELENFIEKLGIRSYSQRLQVLKEEPDVQEKKAEGEKKESRKAQPQTSKQIKAAKVQDTAAKQEGKKKPVQLDEVSSTTRTGKKHKQQNVFEFQQRTLLLIKPGGKWYNLEYTTEFTSQAQDDSESEIAQYKALAQKLFEAETGLYKSKKNLQKGGNSAWMKTVVSTGTLADRMAAMTLLIQDAPVHSLHFVEILVNLVKRKGSRRQNLMALDTLRELLISDLLPENRKLKTFSEHPFSDLEGRSSGNKDARDRRLILWYFEHQLKHQVAEFVMALETLAHDTVVATKARALATAHELLCSRPEQEKALLIQVVNKLGDPQYKTAAKASYLLETLLHKHPNMKTVVCYEVERLLYRPNVNLKAQYYAICFLNQLVLSHEESDLASKLITIYFSFFRGLVKKKDIESKMLSALLSGVNRAYPYAKVGDEKIREQLDTLFKVVHVVNFNTALQALMLLFQVMDSQQAVSDRYYVALYKKLLDPGLAFCSKQSMFLNLLYKSLKADIVLRRVKAFVKRVLQVSCEQSPTFMCGALYLVSEVMKAKPGLRVLLQEHGETDEEEKFKDIDEDEEEEHFTDVDKECQGECEKQEDKSEGPKPAASWVHHKNLNSGKNVGVYDPAHRNPLYCGADSTSLWELKKLSEHFHPSVALFARTVLQGDFIQYTGDPLQDFTLMRFLDRFVYRNPKQNRGKENTDSVVMQPKQKLSMSNVCSFPVNSQQFLDRDESQIPVDEVFFHRYFRKRDTEKHLRRPHGGGDNESVEDVEDEEFEKILDSYEGDSYFTALEEGDNLDFAGNVKRKSRKGKKSAEDSDSDLDEEDAEDLDDEEVSLGSMDEEDFGDELEDDGGAFMDVDDDDDDDDDEDFENGLNTFEGEDREIDETPQTSVKTKTGKRKNSEELDFTGSAESKPGRKKKKGFKDEGSMFAAAEEFGYLLDENTGSKFDNIGINAVANRDKADIKQLKWETQRDDWLRGRDAKTLRKKKTMFKRKKPLGKLKASNKKARK
ncbi:CCAAT/enhancer-binding protein zeta isoform X2 [Acipenser ruthenus]|uniref:CCAAT/enhancer-binding protein zeta isoform X2 n=1 Tax=Acipenser ruthenus TaxID=7906 RepID=UPI0027418479|nr:CCAAT/enhancer-binding protein zeta isoform X2 [Acipenser ruthenus]